MFVPRGRHPALLLLFLLTAASVNLWGGFSNSYLNTAWESLRDFYFESAGETREDDSSSSPSPNPHYDLWWAVTVNIFFPGFIAGLLVSPLLSDRIGRKGALVFGNTVGVGSSILSVVAVLVHCPYFFTALRFVGAFGYSIAFAALIVFLTVRLFPSPDFAQETAPPELAGVSASGSEALYVLGNLLGMAIGFPELLGNSLVSLCLLTVLLSLFSVPLCVLLPESPRFLLRQSQRLDEAARSFYFYYGDTSSIEKPPLEEIEDSSRASLCASFSYLFRTRPGGLALIVSLAALQLTTAYWPLLYLSSDLLQSMGVAPILSRAGALLFIACDFLGTVLGSFVIHRVSRRRLFLCSGALNQVALMAYTVCAYLYSTEGKLLHGCLTSLALYGITYGCAVGPIAYFLPAELVPHHSRALLTGLAIGGNSVICALLDFFTLPLSNHFGSLTLLLLFVGPCVVSLLLLFLLLPETQKRSLSEVLAELSGEKHVNLA